ncbi:membrane protein [Enterococcus florum]|uniref:Membrane protein n=1 Tax=Enterococcus florum TaxID=2480627 RepID=A0A4P5PHQ6_9ENTE|nr:ECF transporter S component [Enterococcus florum]GCF95182.1 membrane protein [Enterococcus florum]
MNTKNKAFRLTIRGILTALIILQVMVPFLGYIPLGITDLTIIHITVIIAAITLGTKDGMFIGLVWGIFTVIRAFTSPTSPLDTLVFTNPIISVVPRILVGLVAGLIFGWIYKHKKNLTLSVILSAVAGTLTNTILVLSLMGILYTKPVAAAYGVDPSALLGVLGTIVATNGVTEVIGAAIITPLIVKALFSATHLKPDNRN